jgi:glutaredoxin-like protein NrdH
VPVPDARGRVPGRRDEHSVKFYGLSTCVWCRRTRKLLEEEGVGFEYVYMDMLGGPEREEALAEIRRWNPRVSYPTLIVDGRECVVGYHPERMKELLGL